jgi:hypothetical protein
MYYSGKHSPYGFHAVASIYAKGGDYQKAIAIEGAKAAFEK